MSRNTFVALLAACALGHTTALDWVQLPQAPWSARSDMCSAVLGDTLVMTGGHRDNDYSGEVWSTKDGSQWTQELAQAPWAGRSYHSCVALPGPRLLIVGGHSKDTWFRDVWISGVGNVTEWTLVTAEAPFPARAAGSLMYQPTSGQLFYLGGSDGLLPPIAKGTTLFNDVWSSADEGKTWTQVSAQGAAAWGAREGESGGTGVVVANDTLLIIGGEAGYFPNYFYGDVWSSVDGANWTERASKAEWVSGALTQYKGRSGHIVDLQTQADGKQALWLSGGYLGRSDVWCLGGLGSGDDLASAPWVLQDKKSPWHGRYDHIMKVMNDKLILFGGENSALGFGGPYFNDVWVATLPEKCE